MLFMTIRVLVLLVFVNMRRLYAYDHRIYLLKCNSPHSFIACMDAFRPNNRSGKFIERFRLFSAQKSEQSL